MLLFPLQKQWAAGNGRLLWQGVWIGLLTGSELTIGALPRFGIKEQKGIPLHGVVGSV